MFQAVLDGEEGHKVYVHVCVACWTTLGLASWHCTHLQTHERGPEIMESKSLALAVNIATGSEVLSRMVPSQTSVLFFLCFILSYKKTH